MSLSKLSIRAMLVVACVVLFAATVHAQYRASIQGVVTDTQGAVVSGAAVTLRNEETGQEYKNTTGSDGVFNFNSLPPSKFTLTVEKTGFRTKTIKGLGVIAEQANSVNVQLEVGQVTETIIVNGDIVPLFDTETAKPQGTVKADSFQKLPS